MSKRHVSRKDQPKPNKIVKIVFEEVDTDEEDVKGCRVYLEAPSRPIDAKVLSGEDRTVSECWGAEVFEFIREQLNIRSQEQQGALVEAPKREDMN